MIHSCSNYKGCKNQYMKIDRQILVRYFLGDCSENEKEAIHQWVERDEVNKQQFINERIRFDASLIIDDRVLSQSQNIVKEKRISILNLVKVASIILLIIMSALMTNYFNQKSTEAKVIVQNIYVPVANRTKLVLADGTLVWLNSNTSLKYPNIFLGKERVVELDGEAYFEVSEDLERPFIVKTSPYNVQVLGTTFNVEAYKEKANFRIELYTGKVKVYNDIADSEPLYMNAGEKAEHSKGELQVSSCQYSGDSWRNGLILIESDSFEVIMLQFEKYFGFKIVINNNDVKNLGYRGKLRISDGIDHALRVLQNDFNFNYYRNNQNDTIYIY